ncbi:hypothetical protein EVA_08190 [gut metagenome]|uniref:Uncharacterized protein n=1 Tax=gut metagenome TaxID=749906 RepID=J9GA29_9ZZZZ
MKYPLMDISQLPQSQDGESQPAANGFPMSNQMTAYVGYGKKEGTLNLTATEPTGNPSTPSKQIHQIPIFRTLGKVSVVAYLQDSITTDKILIEQLNLFNYNRDGLFVPQWQQPNCWNAETGEWNPQSQFDLTAMSTFEKQVGVTPFPLIKSPVVIDSVGSDRSQSITSFYLCQNSFGDKLQADMQPGVQDALGNRTTKMEVKLSDGRISEVVLPYLRRNDHLTIRLKITKYSIKVDFLKWNEHTVTPEWDDSVIPPKDNGNESHP